MLAACVDLCIYVRDSVRTDGGSGKFSKKGQSRKRILEGGEKSKALGHILTSRVFQSIQEEELPELGYLESLQDKLSERLSTIQ